MALKLLAKEAAKFAIDSIGYGYDICVDLRLKYRKGDSPVIEIDGDKSNVMDVVIPGGILISDVPKSIKCDKGERIRFRSDTLTFQQMAEQINQELSLPGKIPAGLFNAMFEFSGCWQRDASSSKTLAFDGMFITLYTVALDKSHMVLKDQVRKEVPSSWDPAALARFITKFGTHIIVGLKMGGKDVIYMKQQHSSALQPADVQKRLKEMADKRFSEPSERSEVNYELMLDSQKPRMQERRLRFEDSGTSNYCSRDDDIISICKRRGGNDTASLTHEEWLETVFMEPDVISMLFIPITSLLNGVSGSGYLTHAANLYMRYKPPLEDLHQFLEFQLPRQWAPVFCDLPLGPQRRQQTTASLQFSPFGPKLFVNTSPVDVGKRPVTGLRLYLEGRRSNRLAIHLQHLSSFPNILQLEDYSNGNFREESYDHRYYEKVNWKNFSHVCTAPVESDEELSIVTGAKLQVGAHGFKKVLLLRLKFSRVVGAVSVKEPEWDGSVGLIRKSGRISTLFSHHFSIAQKPPPIPAAVNINSAVYPSGPPVPIQAPKLLKFVDTTEMTRGPQDPPGYWIVSGARLVVENGKISVKVKYSLLTVLPPDDDDDDVAPE